MNELTHTLTGFDAATAKILDEVQAIFHSRSNRAEKDDWRLEFYIAQVMCADMNSAFEVSREKIKKMVELCNSYTCSDRAWGTAFRRLTSRGFMYSKMHTINPHSYDSHRVRHYALNQSRYDTEEV